MNKREFFEKIMGDSDNIVAKSIAIMRARGFFIDNVDDLYYLSDNATYNDCKYLDELLQKYNVGKIIGLQTKQSCSRNEHLVVVPKTAQIIFNEAIEIDTLIKLFEDTGRYSTEVCMIRGSWKKFLHDGYGRKCSIRMLEPYVSYYVKAISACGMITNYSCDGNHEDGGIIQVGFEYPSSVLYELISREYLTEMFPRINNINFGGIRYEENSKYEMFYKLYECADYLYNNRLKFLQIRWEISAHLKQKKIRNLKDNEVEKMYKDAFYEIIRKRGGV